MSEMTQTLEQTIQDLRDWAFALGAAGRTGTHYKRLLLLEAADELERGTALRAEREALREKTEEFFVALDGFQQQVQTRWKDWSPEMVDNLVTRIKLSARASLGAAAPSSGGSE